MDIINQLEELHFFLYFSKTSRLRNDQLKEIKKKSDLCFSKAQDTLDN